MAIPILVGVGLGVVAIAGAVAALSDDDCPSNGSDGNNNDDNEKRKQRADQVGVPDVETDGSEKRKQRALFQEELDNYLKDQAQAIQKQLNIFLKQNRSNAFASVISTQMNDLPSGNTTKVSNITLKPNWSLQDDKIDEIKTDVIDNKRAKAVYETFKPLDKILDKSIADTVAQILCYLKEIYNIKLYRLTINPNLEQLTREISTIEKERTNISDAIKYLKKHKHI